MRHVGSSKIGPYAVTDEELAQLRTYVREGHIRELASIYPGSGTESLVRFHSAEEAARALEFLS